MVIKIYKKYVYLLLIAIFSLISLSCSHADFIANAFQDFAWIHDNHPKNSWEPRTKSGKDINPDTGRWYNRQVPYAHDYPNSFMDIFYAKESPEESKDCPLLVFMHGGCFWWGDCTTGARRLFLVGGLYYWKSCC